MDSTSPLRRPRRWSAWIRRSAFALLLVCISITGWWTARYSLAVNRLSRFSESAFIAGLLQAPSALSPWTNYEGALERSHVVLTLMREQRFISAEQEEAARRERPRIEPYRSPADPRAGWAKDYLRQQFRNEFGGDHPPGWRVDTGFVPALQEAAERAVSAGVLRVDRRGDPPLEAALVAIDPRTGDILAMVGGSNCRRSTFNRATRSRRQTGSAFKPFVYAAALSSGMTPVTVLSNLDRVTRVGIRNGGPRM